LFQKHRAVWIKWQALVTCALFVVFILYVGVRILRDTYSVRLTTREVRLPSLPAELDGFRLVQLSDLQADPYTDARKMQAYIDLANAQKPDLILFGGDLVTRGTDFIPQGAKMMGRLQARLGVYACLGDHDYWAGPTAVMRHLRENGVTTLEDSVVNFAGSQSKISLTVITNVYSRRPSLATLVNLRRHRTEDAALNILLSHQPSPDIVAYAEEHG
jgi:hypothetical protein